MFQFLGRNSGRSDYERKTYISKTAGRFQFLGRNSGRSDSVLESSCKAFSPAFQFLGRNSGRSDVNYTAIGTSPLSVSIPRSEFWSFGRANHAADRYIRRRFNSSVGILVVRTSRPCRTICSIVLFQFLGRNSGRSDSTTLACPFWMRW